MHLGVAFISWAIADLKSTLVVFRGAALRYAPCCKLSFALRAGRSPEIHRAQSNNPHNPTRRAPDFDMPITRLLCMMQEGFR